MATELQETGFLSAVSERKHETEASHGRQLSGPTPLSQPHVDGLTRFFDIQFASRNPRPSKKMQETARPSLPATSVP